MNNKKDISIAHLGFLILIFCYISFSNSFFIHSHTLSNGDVVVHSHIYDSGESGSEPIHSHSGIQLEIIDNLNLLFNVLIVVAIIFQLFSRKNIAKNIEELFLNQRTRFFIVNKGPPSLLIF